MRALFCALGVAALLGAPGCTLTTATGFEECSTDADCGEGRVCAERYCVVNQTPEGCGRVEGRAEANAIAIGAALPLTPGGQVDQSEVQGLNAILLALEEVNQREGVATRPFALHVCDTQADPERLKLQATWLSDTVGVAALLTSGSAQTIAAASVTVQRGVLVISATATSPELTSLLDVPQGQSVGLVWRTAPSDAIQGRVIADLLVNDTTRFPAVNKVGIVYLNDPYGQGLAEVLAEQLTTSGKTVSSHQYERGGNIDAVVTALDAAAPDLTVLVAFADDAVRLLNAAAAKPNLGTTHRWFFSDSAKDPALISGLTSPSQVDGSYGTAPAQGAGRAFDVFAASFQSRFEADPNQFSYTSHSYDAMYLLALGSAWAVGADGTGEVSGPRIAQGLTHVSSGSSYYLRPTDFTAARSALQQGQGIDVIGASGELQFDAATGEAPSPIELWQISGTGFITVEKRQP